MKPILKIMGYAGPLVLLASVLMFIILRSYPLWTIIMFTLGVVMLTLNRFIGNESDFGRSRDRRMPMNIRRLYRQRCVGTIVLFLSVAILFMHEGFYYGVYMRKATWLLPFIVFCVIEFYAAFRLPSLEKNTSDGKKNV
mgnify:CR=1 FL=1